MSKTPYLRLSYRTFEELKPNLGYYSYDEDTQSYRTFEELKHCFLNCGFFYT